MDDQSVVGRLLSMKKHTRVESSDSESNLSGGGTSCMRRVPPRLFNS